jgi:hypothetical protein
MKDVGRLGRCEDLDFVQILAIDSGGPSIDLSTSNKKILLVPDFRKCQ